MDLSVAALVGIVGLLALNHLVTRVERIGRIPAVHWTATILDLAVAIGVLWLGLPGLEHIPGIHAVVAMVFLLHAVQNQARRTTWEREERLAEQDALRAEYEASQRDRED